MKNLLLVLISCLCLGSTPADTSTDRHGSGTASAKPCEEFPLYVCAFILSIESFAIVEMELHGIPSSITIAQAILETGYGKSELAIVGNNYFGIKGGYNQCEFYYKLEYYRCYDNVETSFKDHSEFLLEKAAFLRLIQKGNTDYEIWASTLQRLDYAVDPDYSDKLIDIIERYNLDSYDF